MRILHYLRRLWVEDGGVLRAVLDMALGQAREGHDVVLLTTDPKDLPKGWQTPGPGIPRVVTVRKPMTFAWLDRDFAKEVRNHIEAAQAVHLHNIWDPSQIPISRACVALGRPYLQSPHGMLADWSVTQRRLKKNAYMTFFGRRLIDEASFIVLTAQGEIDQSAKRHPKTPGVVIPLVFDTDPYLTCPTPEAARRVLKLPDESIPMLLYFSRLHYKKRPDLLLTAGKVLKDAGKKFHMVLAGPGDEPYVSKLKAYANSLGVADITTFTGLVPAECKASLYNACDIFCLPTSMENFGFVYFEALASATPVVTTKGTDTWPEIKSSGAGHIVEMIKSDVPEDGVGGGDVSELAGLLSKLLDDREELRRQGQVGREWTLREMDPRRVASRYIEMYQKAIEELKSRRP